MSQVIRKVVTFLLEERPTLGLCLFLILVEMVLSAAIIYKVPYTEIDWKAYMEEVDGYESGERDYTKIEGNTGPLVYPAGFLYIFSGLKRLTDEGSNIFKAQVIFAGIYIVNLAVVLILYCYGRIPSFAACLLLISKRIHSIYMLRMFNDCIAVLLGFMAISLFCRKQWGLGSVAYSLAVSIKMNMLLYAPGVLAMYLFHLGYFGALQNIAVCAVVQIVLGYPFLSTFPVQYISKAFELSRVFFYKWTVNYKFLPEDIFLDKRLSLALLVMTVAAYIIFALRWTSQYRKGFMSIAEVGKGSKDAKEWSITAGPSQLSNHGSPNMIIFTIMSSNLIGIVFARSLHYQFYCWYFHSLPYLLFQTNLPIVVRIVVLLTIEYSFNVFPASALSSAALQICHVVLLASLYFSKVPFEEGKRCAKDLAQQKNE